MAKLKSDAGVQETKLAEKQAKANQALNMISRTMQGANTKKEQMESLRKEFQIKNDVLNERYMVRSVKLLRAYSFVNYKYKIIVFNNNKMNSRKSKSKRVSGVIIIILEIRLNIIISVFMSKWFNQISPYLNRYHKKKKKTKIQLLILPNQYS